MITTTWVMTDAENGSKKKIGWFNLGPTVVAAILISLLLGGYAFYRKVDNSLVTVSDLQKKQIEQAEADFEYKREMNATMFNLTIAVERLIVKTDNQEVAIGEIKTSIKELEQYIRSTKEYKKQVD